MPINITMPALSPTMTEGNLSKWLKKEGDVVKSGDVIAEIETDKATMEVESADEGTLSKIVVPAGSEAVKVGALIAMMLEEGESASDVPAPKPAAPAPALTSAAPTPVLPVKALPQADAANGRIFVSPLARRLAAESGLKLDTITGSGPHGRIVKADIEAARAAAPPDAAPTAAPAAPAPAPKPASASAAAPAGNGKDRVVGLAGNIPYDFTPHTSMRKTIARRLTEAKQTVPHFYLTIDCIIDDLLKVRRELNEKARDRYKLSVNDFVIRASALALREVPECNASFSDEGTLTWRQVDIAVAVAIEGGLITPIVKQADNKGLADISNAMRDLGARAKAGKLKPDEYQGGTFSISNLGMFGIREFAAVINPPHGAILAVGAGEERPVVKNGALATATVMTSTLSVDHRVVDGATGAKFLQAFKRLIEDPLTMLL